MCNTFQSSTEVADSSLPIATPIDVVAVKEETKRSVRFNQNVKVYAHIHFRDLSHRVISRTWYSLNEQVMLEETAVKEANYIGKQASAAGCSQQQIGIRALLVGPLSAQHDCSRGLEIQTRTGAQRRHQHKAMAWSAVFEEQDRQWDAGTVEPDALAEVYSACSSNSVVEAHLIALKDEKDVIILRMPVRVKSSFVTRRKCPSAPSLLSHFRRAA